MDTFATQQLRCCRCGAGDQLQKTSAIVASGTVQITSSGTSHIPLSFRRVNHYTTTNQISGLAQRLAPPIPPRYSVVGPVLLGLISVLCITSSDLGNVLIGVCGLALAAFFFFKGNETHKKKLSEYQEAYRVWDSAYYCYRCDYLTVIPGNYRLQ